MADVGDNNGVIKLIIMTQAIITFLSIYYLQFNKWLEGSWLDPTHIIIENHWQPTFCTHLYKYIKSCFSLYFSYLSQISCSYYLKPNLWTNTIRCVNHKLHLCVIERVHRSLQTFWLRSHNLFLLDGTTCPSQNTKANTSLHTIDVN